MDLDGTPEPFTVLNDTTITFTVTDDADTGQITVTTPYGSTTSNDFFLDYQVPIIIWFAPNTGGPGTVVTLSGIYFSGATVVTFGGVPATSITVVNDSTIYATVGNGATGAITVTNPVGTSDPVDTFTFVLPPTIASFSPSSGVTTKLVNITGTGFTNASAVAFGGTPAASFTVNSDSSITAVVGSGATGTLTVTTPGGTATSAGTFTYIPTVLTGITLTAMLAAPQIAGTADCLHGHAAGQRHSSGERPVSILLPVPAG